MTKIQSLAISGILTLNAHSLNNEGTEGNTTETRMVQIVDKDGKRFSVNSISGDMFKHIQYENFVRLSKNENMMLCEGCTISNPNRINLDDKFGKANKEAKNDVLLSNLLKHCAGDDVEGVMITNLAGKKKSVARKSVVEFSWVIGMPNEVETNSHFHVKFDKKNLGKGSGSDDGANLGQNIFHKPNSSGRYAVVVNLDLFRIGLNDVTNKHAIDDAQVTKRKKLLLNSIITTFLKPEGAQRSTKNPHILNFEGIISYSLNVLPSPSISPLHNDEKSSFVNEIESIADSLNAIYKDIPIKLKKFSSLADFTKSMSDLSKEIE